VVDTATRTWYHTIDLPDGSVTPGWFDSRPVVRAVPWPPEIAGGRCLDVGTFDGFWAFELERRGAKEVVAIDVDDPQRLDFAWDMKASGPQAIQEWGSSRGPGFANAREALGSDVIRKNRSVYELDPVEDGEFDVVFCGALLLHLRDPALALEKMRSVCRGSLVIVESIDSRLELIAPRLPVASIRPYPDQWWVPNSAGLEKLLNSCGFVVRRAGRRVLVGYGPGGPRRNDLSLLSGLVAGQPGKRGVLHRVWLAKPRPPAGR
jgi:tRNA (mo5U34)-methyltransferase